MNPLYVDSQRVGLGVDKFSLYVKNLKTGKLIEKFEPRNIPYDSIFIQRPNGFVSFAALNWLEKHAVSLTVMDWKGNVLAQFLPEEPVSNELKIAQIQAYLNREKRLSIAKRIVETKLERQSQLLRSLSESYPFIEVPRIPAITSAGEDLLRNQEARFAEEYFTQFGAICKQLGFRFRVRRSDRRNNMNAADLVNGLLNYGYGFLKSYVRRSLNSVGLDNTIPFMHELRNNRGLVFDMMELWRTNVDYSVLLCLAQLRRERTHRLTDEYTVLLDPETIRLLFEKLKLNLSLEELILNCRILAKHILGEKERLEFVLRPVRTGTLSESASIKETILSESASQLGMNKSTLWYMKKRLERTGSIRLYSKTKTHF